jgi:D-alanine-D-alanine ligase
MSSAKDFGKVAVMYGGHSSERAVSLESGKAVLNALLSSGIDAHAFDPAYQLLTDLINQNFDRVFIVLHGRGGEDGSMQGALETIGIPYTGSGVLGSALAMDKVRCKLLWSQLGLSTADYRVIVKGHNFDENQAATIFEELGNPVMVKPALEGSSVGMVKAKSPQELVSGVEKAFELDEQVLIEAFIEGQEYTVTWLNGQSLPSINMVTPRDFYDYTAKYHGEGTTQYFCPSGLSEQHEKELACLAHDAFVSVGGTGWGRVDVMRNKQGQFFLLEANTVPGMTASSLVQWPLPPRG